MVPLSQRLEIGNWLHTWIRGLLNAVSRNQTFTYQLPNASSHVQMFLRFLPGIGSSPQAEHILLQSGIPRREWSRVIAKLALHSWREPICCQSEKQVLGLVAARPIGAWALRTAYRRYGRHMGSAPAARAPAVLHFRCGDAPASRHGNYHLMRFSGWRLQVSRLMATGKLRSGDQLRVVSCFRHESVTPWERAYGSGHRTRPEALEHSCRAYAADLLGLLTAVGLQPSWHHCEGDMIDDFLSMAAAPALLTAASSMSFMAGFFGESGLSGGFQVAGWLGEGRSPCRNNPECPPGTQPLDPAARPAHCAECEAAAKGWMVPAAHMLPHAQVRSYFNASEVIALLHAPPTPPTTTTLPATATAPAALSARLRPSGRREQRATSSGRATAARRATVLERQPSERPTALERQPSERPALPRPHRAATASRCRRRALGGNPSGPHGGGGMHASGVVVTSAGGTGTTSMMLSIQVVCEALGGFGRRE
jgi:hypothetical protein